MDPTPTNPSSTAHKDLHRDVHAEAGALPGEHPGRSRNPVIKVVDLAWLEFEKPDLTRAEAFARAFGFQTAQHGPDELHLRGTDAGAPCVILRRGAADTLRAAWRSAPPTRSTCCGWPTAPVHPPARCRRSSAACRRPDRPERLPGPRGRGHARTARAARTRSRTVFNVGHDTPRINATQRPPAGARAGAATRPRGAAVDASTSRRSTGTWTTSG